MPLDNGTRTEYDDCHELHHLDALSGTVHVYTCGRGFATFEVSLSSSFCDLPVFEMVTPIGIAKLILCLGSRLPYLPLNPLSMFLENFSGQSK